MLIFGRSPTLLLALLGATFNLLVVFQVGGFHPTPEQIGQVNGFLLAFVAFVANSDKVAVSAGRAAVRRIREKSGEPQDERIDDDHSGGT